MAAAAGGRPGSRVEAVLAGRAAKGAPVTGSRVSVRVDRIALDALVTAEVLAAAAGAVSRSLRLTEPTRWAFVAGAEASAAQRLELAERVAALGVAVALEPALAGLPGVVATDEGLVGSDDVVVGTTADVGALGALGCVPLRCGLPELVALLTEPTLTTLVPPTRFLRVTGRLPRWAAGFDLALAVIDAIGEAGGASGAVLELHGETIEALDIPARLALCGTLALAGLCALIPPDARTRTWLAARRPGGGPGAGAARSAGSAAGRAGGAGGGAAQHSAGVGAPSHIPPLDTVWIEVDATRARPAALEGGLSGRRLEPGTAGSRPVVECLVGGRIEDLRQAAEVLRDRNARRGLALGIQPASQRTLLHAIDEGLASDFLRAGATLLAPGARPAPPLAGRVRAATVPGGPFDLLANPAVVAASAIPGRLMEPDAMRRAMPRDSRLR